LPCVVGGYDEEAVMFTPKTMRDGFAPHLPRFKKNERERCWVWFRYLSKNLSPHEFKQVGDQCARQRDIFVARHRSAAAIRRADRPAASARHRVPHDSPVAERLIRRAKPSKHLLGDKAYDSAELRNALDERGTKPTIPNPIAATGNSRSASASVSTNFVGASRAPSTG
jgi:hypothetical protein